MYENNMSKSMNSHFVADIIMDDIENKVVTQEQGKQAMLNLLLMVCGAYEATREVA